MGRRVASTSVVQREWDDNRWVQETAGTGIPGPAGVWILIRGGRAKLSKGMERRG
jgi:hypothetical protein